jgi:hypothetical protein
MEEKQEKELLEGFRRLCPADRNTIITAVSMAVTAEEAIKRHFGVVSPVCVDCEAHPRREKAALMGEEA